MKHKEIELCPECYEKQTGKRYRPRRFIAEYSYCESCGAETIILIYPKRGLWLERAKNRLLYAIFRER